METHPKNGTGTDPLFKVYHEKIVLDYERLRKVVAGFQALGRKVVLTIGSWDGLHIGQVRYIVRAKAAGDLLVVAFDTDRAVKAYKSPHRPIVPEAERAEMITYLKEVDFVTAIDDVDEDGHWQYGLLKTVKPDVFIAVVDSYPESQLNDIRSFGVEVIVLPRQAEDSTSAAIGRIIKAHLLPALDEVIGHVAKKR